MDTQFKTNDLINSLSTDAGFLAAGKPLKSPLYYTKIFTGFLLIYGILVQCYQNLRPDLRYELLRPEFLAEIVLLVALILMSMRSAILSLYPDLYQKKGSLNLPYYVFGGLFVFLSVQALISPTQHSYLSLGTLHEIECTICIAGVSLLPSLLTFWMLRKGSPLDPMRAGSFAVLVATGIGCLTLRLSEENVTYLHLITWHYLPTFLFAMLGAFLGKYVLKW
jgi:hypothetical protein